MKLVYICSRYRADVTHTVEEAVDSALYACSVAISKGYAPIAPHLYLPRCLDDNEPAERAAGTAAGLAFLAVCDEVWQWGKTITEGMAELDALQARQAAHEAAEDHDGFQIVRNAEQNRLQIIFDGKPDEATRSALKSNGFRWSPRNNAWQRQLTDNAERAARRSLGLDD